MNTFVFFLVFSASFIHFRNGCEGLALDIKLNDYEEKKEADRNVRETLSLETEAPPSGSELGSYDNAAIAADGTPCSSFGINILKSNGSTADATIATMFCLGAVVAESMGMGGGFFLVYYDRDTESAYTLDARETAPENAYEDMYGGDPELSAYGGLSVAVPGEVRGYYALYERFGGKVPWADLIQPTVDLCEEGFEVLPHMAMALQSKRSRILDEPTMSIFVDPNTGDVYKEGDILKRPDLASTLREIQADPDALYTGSLSEGFLNDLNDLGSIITRNDLENYTPIWKETVSVNIENGGYKMYSVPPPGSGIILGFILNILDNYNFTAESLSEENIVTTNQRIAEAFKYAYAKRTELGDQDFVNMDPLIRNLTSEFYARDIYSRILDNQTSQDPGYYGAVSYEPSLHGTDQLSVWGNDGSIISITSTVNLYFGGCITSTSTGIVLNDEMDDFSSPNITNSFDLPPSPANFIVPGKRPVSSMCPAIFTNPNGDVRLVVGAAGGSTISTATAWVAMHNLWFGKDIKESVDSRRLHHQLFPMFLQYEEEYRMDIVEELEEIGHKTVEFEMGISIVNSLARGEDGRINANSDFRKCSDINGF